MPDLVLNDEQAALVERCSFPVTVRDVSGRKLGELRASRVPSDDESGVALSVDELTEIQRRMSSDGPWVTSEEVLDHLKALESK